MKWVIHLFHADLKCFHYHILNFQGGYFWALWRDHCHSYPDCGNLLICLYPLWESTTDSHPSVPSILLDIFRAL